MSKIHLRITTQSPLLLSAGPAAHNLTETLDFIPGNTLRGLLAYRYLSMPRNNARHRDFQKLFLSDEVRFGFAYIENSQIIPLSARSCKYYPGFQENNGHGVLDMLLADPGKAEPPCQCCGKPLDYFTGFADPDWRLRSKVKKRLIARTAIDPVRAAASQGKLYSQRVIEEGQAFYATIEYPKDRKATLNRILDQEAFIARIGTGTSRGQGWVQVEKCNSVPAIAWDSAERRFDQFPQYENKPMLAITLLSDSIFSDDYLRDSSQPTPGHLTSLDINPKDWEKKPIKAYAATRLVFGFDGYPIHLPRIPRLAVCAGSTYLFIAKTTKPVIPSNDGVGWIGDNQREGYGQVVLWHPFHLCFRSDQTAGVE